MKQTVIAFSLALGLVIVAGTAAAHHSPSAYNNTETTVQKGVLTKVDWTNPHIQIHVDVKDQAGKVTPWTFEGHPPAWFQKAGIHKFDFMKGVGQMVTVDGNPAKDGAPLGYFTGISFADGTKLRFDNNSK